MDSLMSGVVLFYLGILSFWDYKERQVPVVWLLAGAFLLPGMGMVRCFAGEYSKMEYLAGALPGIMLLIIAWMTQKAGYADGLVLIEVGLYSGYRQSMLLSCFSLLLSAIVSACLLTVRKVNRNTKLPYLPFLFTVYFILWIS